MTEECLDRIYTPHAGLFLYKKCRVISDKQAITLPLKTVQGKAEVSGLSFTSQRGTSEMKSPVIPKNRSRLR